MESARNTLFYADIPGLALWKTWLQQENIVKFLTSSRFLLVHKGFWKVWKGWKWGVGYDGGKVEIA